MFSLFFYSLCCLLRDKLATQYTLQLLRLPFFSSCFSIVSGCCCFCYDAFFLLYLQLQSAFSYIRLASDFSILFGHTDISHLLLLSYHFVHVCIYFAVLNFYLLATIYWLIFIDFIYFLQSFLLAVDFLVVVVASHLITKSL